MLNNSETLSLPQFLAAQRAVEDAAIAFKVSQALALVQKALRYAGAQRRAELRDDLILDLLSVAAESARNPKRWRIGRSWIKDENGALAKLSLLDLEARDWIR